MFFASLIEGIGEAIVEFFSMLFYVLVRGLLQILYYIEVAFYWLAGAGNPLDVKEGNELFEQNVILEVIQSDKAQVTFWIFLVIALGVFVVCTILGIVRSHMVGDGVNATKKVFSKALQSILVFVGISAGFMFFMIITTNLMMLVINLVSQTLGSGDGQISSISETLFKSLFTGETNQVDYIFSQKVTLFENSSFENIHTNLGYDLSLGAGNFNFLMGIIVACVILWAMMVCTLGLVERIINLILLYFIGPVTVGTSPMDDGERFKAWRGLVLAKALGVFGNILSVYIYLYLIGMFSSFASADSSLLLKMIYYVMAIGGAFTASKGSNLIASIISRDAGAQDGWSQSQTNAMLQGGMNLAKGVIGGAMIGGGAIAKNIAGGSGAGVGSGLASAARNVSGAFAGGNGAGGKAMNNARRGAVGTIASGIGRAAKTGGSALAQGLSNARFQGAMSGGTQGLVGGAVALTGAAVAGLVRGIGATGKGIKSLAAKNPKIAAKQQENAFKKQLKDEKRQNAKELKQDNRDNAYRQTAQQRLGKEQKILGTQIALEERKETLKAFNNDEKLLNEGKLEASAFKEKYGVDANDKKAMNSYKVNSQKDIDDKTQQIKDLKSNKPVNETMNPNQLTKANNDSGSISLNKNFIPSGNFQAQNKKLDQYRSLQTRFDGLNKEMKEADNAFKEKYQNNTKPVEKHAGSLSNEPKVQEESKKSVGSINTTANPTIASVNPGSQKSIEPSSKHENNTTQPTANKPVGSVKNNEIKDSKEGLVSNNVETNKLQKENGASSVDKNQSSDKHETKTAPATNNVAVGNAKKKENNAPSSPSQASNEKKAENKAEGTAPTASKQTSESIGTPINAPIANVNNNKTSVGGKSKAEDVKKNDSVTENNKVVPNKKEQQNIIENSNRFTANAPQASINNNQPVGNVKQAAENKKETVKPVPTANTNNNLASKLDEKNNKNNDNNDDKGGNR